MKQLELNFDKKPIAEPTKKEVEKKIATFGDPKSNGVWKNFVDESNNIKNKENELGKLIRFGVEESQTPVSKSPQGSKQHKTDVLTYIDKMKKMYEPPENDIERVKEATPEQIGKLAERLERSRQMTGELNTWDLMKKTADTPAEKNELKRILNKEFYKYGPKNMAPDDLKYIGKYKKPTYPEIKIPVVDGSLINGPPTKPEPKIPLRDQIKILADQRLIREQRTWDREHGRDGITNVLRPK